MIDVLQEELWMFMWHGNKIMCKNCKYYKNKKCNNLKSTFYLMERGDGNTCKHIEKHESVRQFYFIHLCHPSFGDKEEQFYKNQEDSIMENFVKDSLDKGWTITCMKIMNY